MDIFTRYAGIWIATLIMMIFIAYFFGKRMLANKKHKDAVQKQLEAEKVLFSNLTSAIFDETETVDLTKAAIYNLLEREKRLYDDPEYDGNFLPHLNHDEKLVFTMYQVENSLGDGDLPSIKNFFLYEPYCDYKPYYKEAYETIQCPEIAHLLEEAEKLTDAVEKGEEDNYDMSSDYALYNFSDFTNELVALIRSSGLPTKAGEFIRAHKDSFVK